LTDKKTSATKTFKFVGKAQWAKVYEADEFRGTKNWKIDLNLDKENLEVYKESGIQGKVRENEEGPLVSFKRPTTKLIKGVQQIFSGPRIIDKDGKPIVEYKKNAEGTAFDRVGEPVLIGNGSVVECTVSVYPTSMGPGQRLETVKIIDLIEYTPSAGGEFGSDRIVVGATPDSTVKAPW
jgi:hypothetical protein